MYGPVVVIIHGTFARAERWWKLSDEGAKTFATALEEELARRGVHGTVWGPNGKLKGREFSWSGENSDYERRKAAKDLSLYLTEWARELGCTAENPLLVHLIGHSHGGNVVLEALKHLPGSVSPGRIILLGTPLISIRPCARFASFYVYLLALITLFISLFSLEYTMDPIVKSFFEPLFNTLPEPQDLRTFALFIVGGTFFGIIFSLGMYFMMVAPGLIIIIAGMPIVRIIDEWWEPRGWRILQKEGMTDGQFYGPSCERLSHLLKWSILTMVSRYDEASVLIELGISQGIIWSFIFRKISKYRIVRLFLWPFLLFARYIISVAGFAHLGAAEIRLLGIYWKKCNQFVHRLADLNNGAAYRQPPFKIIDVTKELTAAAQGPANIPEFMDPYESGEDTLLQRLGGIYSFFGSQIRFRHSLYYNSVSLKEMIAETICETHRCG